MKSPEGAPIPHPALEIEFRYANPHTDPVVVAANTVEIFEGYFNGRMSKGETEYLTNQTADLLYRAKVGFLRNYKKIRSLIFVSPRR